MSVFKPDVDQFCLLSTIQGLVDFTARLKNPYTKKRGVGIRLSE